MSPGRRKLRAVKTTFHTISPAGSGHLRVQMWPCSCGDNQLWEIHFHHSEEQTEGEGGECRESPDEDEGHSHHPGSQTWHSLQPENSLDSLHTDRGQGCDGDTATHTDDIEQCVAGCIPQLPGHGPTHCHNQRDHADEQQISHEQVERQDGLIGKQPASTGYQDCSSFAATETRKTALIAAVSIIVVATWFEWCSSEKKEKKVKFLKWREWMWRSVSMQAEKVLNVKCTHCSLLQTNRKMNVDRCW